MRYVGLNVLLHSLHEDVLAAQQADCDIKQMRLLFRAALYSLSSA